MREVCKGCEQQECGEASDECAAFKFLKWFCDLSETNSITTMKALQEYHEGG